MFPGLHRTCANDYGYCGEPRPAGPATRRRIWAERWGRSARRSDSGFHNAHESGCLKLTLPTALHGFNPGVINLDLSKQTEPLGFHFAPDPSSQQVCTIGGNVANNSGGPHCLAYGVTNAHVLAVEVVLSSGEAVLLGGLEAEPSGYDLRGAFVGSEGMFGIATKIAVRLTPNPESIKTLLLSFDTVADAAATVGAVIASGLVPAAIEIDGQALRGRSRRLCARRLSPRRRRGTAD